MLPRQPIVIPAPPPDFSLEFAECFNSFIASLEDSGLTVSSLESLIQTAIENAVESGRESLLGNPLTAGIAALFAAPPREAAVFFLCSKLDHQVAGIWLKPTFHSPTPALNALNTLPPGQLFALQFSAATLQEFIDAVWTVLQASNRRLNSDGLPDPSGSLEIKQRPSLSSPTPATIQIQIRGTYHLPLGFDIDFTLTNLEALSILPIGGGLGIVTSTSSHTIDLDQTDLDAAQAAVVLLSLFGGFFAAPVSALVTNLIWQAIANGESQIPTLFDLGSWVAAFVPPQFVIDKTPNKLLLPIDQVTCDLGPNGRGITISGSQPPSVVPRRPSLGVDGPFTILVNRYVDQSLVVNETYTLRPGDLSTIVSYSWMEGATVVSTGPIYDAAFDIQGMKVGQSRTFAYTVTVQDNGGLTAKANFSVTITIVNYKPSLPPKSTGLLTTKAF